MRLDACQTPCELSAEGTFTVLTAECSVYFLMIPCLCETRFLAFAVMKSHCVKVSVKQPVWKMRVAVPSLT